MAASLWTTAPAQYGQTEPMAAIRTLVFWGGSVGHVAVSIGNGAVVGTQGYSALEPTVLQSIAAITKNSGYPYEGWVAIP